MSKLALQLIQQEKAAKTGYLELGNCGLTPDNPLLQDVWNTLSELTHLETLILSNEWYNWDEKSVNWDLRLSKNQYQDNWLNQIPEPIAKLINLKRMMIGGNAGNRWGIEKLENLRTLVNLECLYISHNEIKKITGIEQLISLQKFYISYNEVTKLENLENLISLQDFAINANQITKLEGLENLISLEYFHIHSNEINKLEGVDTLHNLRHFNIGKNQISKIENLPKSISRLNIHSNQINKLENLPKNIHWLNVNDNHISKLENLPQKIDTLCIVINKIKSLKNLPQSISQLDIDFNKIKDIKPLLPFIKKGIIYRAFENPIENPPMQVVKQGTEAILRYFEELEKSGETQVKEAKLLLTGSGEVGKTSLRYRLNDKSRPLPEQDERTRQVDVDPYRFALLPEGEFTAQIWDFGGQHIIHHFHRFFMNDSALYVLMTETSKDNKDDFDYWLQTIKLYGKNSPILFVQNQKYGMPRPLDIRPFKEHFNIKDDLFEVNLKTNEGLDTLEKAIQYHISNLPHTQRTIPRSWLAIREALEGRRAASGGYITYDEFREICKTQGITERVKMEDVGRFLHRLGVILWYADNPVLRQKIILERHWATEGVFKLVFDKDIQKTGYFSFDQAQSLWDFDDAYCHHAEDLIELMREFKVCFPCKHDEKQYIIPALLTAVPPEVAWLSDTRMTVEYHYPTILPRGLVNYLTAEMYRLIDDDTHAWSAGVWLHAGNTQAKIEENQYNRKIKITVAGAQHRELFGSIKNTLDSIHKDYPGMSPQLMIPCVCDTCAPAPQNEKEYYAYDKIVLRLEKGKRTVECDVSYDNIPVEKLLNHILRREDYDKNYQVPKIMKKVFFSYSKKDKTLRDELDRFLAPLKSKIATWHDRDIMPGAKWDAEIKAELNDADIVLCLVSADFLATDYIMDVELPIMLERYKKGELEVIPIILRPCGWEYTTLSEFNALPEKGKSITKYENKDTAFLEVLNGINRVIESTQASPK